jgi:hypothetical protein
MCNDVYSGTTTALWLPARGRLCTLQVGGLRERIGADGDVIDVVVGGTRVQRR